MPPTPLLPYVPPDISVYYTSSSSSSSEPQPTQVAVDLEHRDSFTFLENFYNEPPMSSVEAYQAPVETVYESKNFEETWKPSPTPPPSPTPEDQEQKVEEEDGKEERGIDKQRLVVKKQEEEEGTTSKKRSAEEEVMYIS